MACGLYYKDMTIVNYTSSVVNKLEALLTDDARVVIYDRHVFIVQATVYDKDGSECSHTYAAFKIKLLLNKLAFTVYIFCK